MYKIEGWQELDKTLSSMITEHPEMQKMLKGFLMRSLRVARLQLQNSAKTQMESDPRQAFRAVRSAIWRRALGGNVNILARRKNNGKQSTYEPPRKPHKSNRGGNRMPRSQRTKDLMGYYGTDRGFILRFLNAGAGLENPRITKFGAKRGTITARNWFAPAADQSMQQAAEMFAGLVDRAILHVWNNESIDDNG